MKIHRSVLIGGSIGAVVGFAFGSSIGIAAFGSAVNGALPVAINFLIIGALVGDRFRRR